MIHRHSHRAYQAFRPLVLGVCLTTLAACNLPVNERGHLPKTDALEQVKPGVSDKATVQRLLGTPSTVAAFDGDTWYYISRETRQVAFLRPDVLDQEVYIVRFNEDGIVKTLDHRGLKDSKSLTPNPDTTPAQGREFTFLEQLIGNFGKFNNAGKDRAASPGPSGN
jgi:outer membrane protein assembly factor BamE (lipoprotein component of BamABCDE complex)